VNVSLFQAASALNANSRWQEVIADNLASSAVPGYKGQQLTTAAIQAGLLPTSNLLSAGLPQNFVLPKAAATTNFQPGLIKYTGDSTDVAIDGQGFFAVQLPTGATGYTRNGEFQINTHGQLVTSEGYTVLGVDGPIQKNLQDPSPLSISTNGQVSQGASIKGQLKLTDFDQPGLLTQISGGYFVAQNPNINSSRSTSTLRQNYLEASNTSTVSEMANLITATRGFEANQHVIQIQDDRLAKTISELGNPT
jgi:flagellar basal body rod protein FlgG